MNPALQDEVVLIGAHLDSWHTAAGATDNADGVTAAMEAMRILKAVGAQPRRTVRVALWSGEEQGLLGARAYVKQHLAAESARARISVYLNDDPGTGATYGFYMQKNEAAKRIFDGWLEPLRDLGVRRNVIEGIGATGTCRSTNLEFPPSPSSRTFATTTFARVTRMRTWPMRSTSRTSSNRQS